MLSRFVKVRGQRRIQGAQEPLLERVRGATTTDSKANRLSRVQVGLKSG